MVLCSRILLDMNRKNIKIYSRFICIIEKSIKNYKKVYAYEKNGKNFLTLPFFDEYIKEYGM